MKSYTSTFVVTEQDTAQAQGSGNLPVLATPRLVALMENAAMNCAEDLLPEGSTTVGGQISTTHLRPSAVGATIAATAVLEEQDGKKLTFKVQAYDGETLLGEGSHIRFIVDKEKFMSRL